MRKKFINKMWLPVVSLLVFTGPSVWAEESDSKAVETVKEAGRDVKKNAKQVSRKVKDETCQGVKGKLECAGQKVKHKTQNAVDEVKDKADDVN